MERDKEGWKSLCFNAYVFSRWKDTLFFCFCGGQSEEVYLAARIEIWILLYILDKANKTC